MQSVACGKVGSRNFPNESSRSLNWVQQGWYLKSFVESVYSRPFSRTECVRFARSWIGPGVCPFLLSNRVNRNQWEKVRVQSWYHNIQDVAGAFHYCQHRGWRLPYNQDLRDGLIVFRPASPDKRESRPPRFQFCKIYFEILNGAFYVLMVSMIKRTLVLYYAHQIKFPFGAFRNL